MAAPATKSSLPPPDEIITVSEQRINIPEGTEILKKRLLVYNSPVPCNTYINEENARHRKGYRDPTAINEVSPFIQREVVQTVDKRSLREQQLAQIEQRRVLEERRRAAERSNEAQLLAERLASEHERIEIERDAKVRKANETLHDMQVASQQTKRQTTRTVTEPTGVSLNITGLERTRVNDQSRRTSAIIHEQIITRKAQAAAAREDDQARARARAAEDAAAAERANAELRAKREAQRAFFEQSRLIAEQQKEAQRVRQQNERAAAAAEIQIKQQEFLQEQAQQRERRVQRQQQFASGIESSKRRIVNQPERVVVTRVEDKVVLRCPKTGKLLEPSQFNMPRGKILVA